jgi:hypothetical protein
MTTIPWTKMVGISLAQAARVEGFDLSNFDDYGSDTQSELKKKAITNAMAEIADSYFDQTDEEFWTIDRGVYVICVGWPFAIQYESQVSDVIYIGIGRVASRLESHFYNSLFDLMQSLQGVDFSFYVSVPRLQKAPDYYKHVEYLMLEAFRKTIGGGKEYPLLNSNAGSERNVRVVREGWKLPLKRTGKRPRWLGSGLTI